jgi:HEAT repeat protein
MHEVVELCKDEMLPVPDLGEDNAEVANEAHQVALTLLQTLAWRDQTGEPPLSKQEIRESLLAEQIPPAEERPAQLEGTILNLLQETPFLDWQNKVAEFRHPVWQDIWLAHQLAETQDVSILRDHLQDPDWILVLESYIGMAPSKALVATLLKTGMVEDELRTLLESTRWAILAPDEAVWRKYVLKALAKAFVKRKFTLDEKLMLGKALALIAEESVRPFFLKALRHPEAGVRAAAFRGLGWTGQPRDVQMLAAGLNDDTFEVQESAVRALGDIGTPGAYRLLKDTLAEVDERLMLIVAETLAEDPQGWDALKEALETPDLLIRRAAVHGLGQIDAPWTKEIFEEIMREDTQWLVRSAAEAALQDEDKTLITAKTTVQPPPTMEESAWLITWAAQEGLGVGVGDAAVKMLLRALHAEDAHARFLSSVTLGRIGHLDHLADLTALLEEEEDANVREVAKEAKTQIETRYQDVVFDA